MHLWPPLALCAISPVPGESVSQREAFRDTLKQRFKELSIYADSSTVYPPAGLAAAGAYLAGGGAAGGAADPLAAERQHLRHRLLGYRLPAVGVWPDAPDGKPPIRPRRLYGGVYPGLERQPEPHLVPGKHAGQRRGFPGLHPPIRPAGLGIRAA